MSPMGSPLALHISAQGSREAVQGEEETERDREQRVTLVHIGVPRTASNQDQGTSTSHSTEVPPGPQGAQAHGGRDRALLLL